MRGGCWCLAWTASLIFHVGAINLPADETNHQKKSPSILTLDTQRRSTAHTPASRDERRKRSAFQLTLDNESTLYFANVSVGTPAQHLSLDIDTGSSDIWANSASSTLCTQYRGACSQSGTYNANRSSTYSYINSGFYIKYADGSNAKGDYGMDTMQLGGMSIGNVPFGIGYQSSSSQGILGVGYASNEASVSTTGRTYQNLPLLLVSQKITNTAAYSLWLNDLDANTGSIMFGGVDTDKYHGEIQTIPVIKEEGIFREFVIGLTSLKVDGQSIIESPIPVLLDSGSSLSYLPDNFAKAIFSKFNAQYNDQAGAATVSCNLRSSDSSLEFAFGSVVISVPMNELIILDGSTRRGQDVCILGISMAGQSSSVLGDTFLRSAYVVYDITNNQIGIAPTNFNATSSNIKEIATGTNGIPGASPATGAVSSLSVSTGGARNGGQPQVTDLSFAVSVDVPLKMLSLLAGMSFLVLAW